MRLLNSCTGEMREFITDSTVPPYAILSHTWDDEEITFQEWQNTPSKDVVFKRGYRKINYCFMQAFQDGLEWVWMDTCCIDKTSSEELSQAINSMFRWYQNSVVCYAYLSDVSYVSTRLGIEPKLKRSRWFTRGWTLQELLAPKTVQFYSSDWSYLGSKTSLQPIISSITGIDSKYIHGEDLKEACIAQKMSWAAERSTSRAEDIAYCLLGLFDINIPLLYGEGQKAFRRLQHEIMKSYPYDHTLFAWGTIIHDMDIFESRVCRNQKDAEPLPAWDENESQKPLLGLFADSPYAFKDSGNLRPLMHSSNAFTRPVNPFALPTIIGNGVRIDFEVAWSVSGLYYWNEPKIIQKRNIFLVLLGCGFDPLASFSLCLQLQPWGHSSYGRTEKIVKLSGPGIAFGPWCKASSFHVEPERRTKVGTGDFLMQEMICPYVWNLRTRASTGFWSDHDGLLQPRLECTGLLAFLQITFPEPDTHLGVSIIISRVDRIDQSVASCSGLLSLSALPLALDVSDGTRSIEHDNMIWYSPRYHLPEKEFLYTQTMGHPRDIWEVNDEHFPLIQVQTQRVSLKDPTSFVDVLRIRVSPKKDLPVGGRKRRVTAGSKRP